MDINAENCGPLLEIAGLVVILLAVVLSLAGMALWPAVVFAGGFVELLGFLILINTW